jgi:hypothetical protein
MAQENEEFEELKRVYSWLNDDYMAALQALYPTWSQLAEANRLDLVQILSEIPVPPGSPQITPDNVMALQAFAKEKIRLEGSAQTGSLNQQITESPRDQMQVTPPLEESR